MLPRYTVEVSHNGLGKYRVISGTDYLVVQAKAKALQLSWDEEYRRKQAKDREKNAKEQERRNRIRSKEERQEEIEEKIDEASDRTEEAKAALVQIQNILCHALELKHAIKWEKLRRTDPYPTPEPAAPSYLEYPPEPKREGAKYQPSPYSMPEPNREGYKPNLNFWDKIFKSWANKKIQAADELYAGHHAAWVENARQTEMQNKQKMDELFLRDYSEWEAAVPKVQLENQKRYDANVVAINQWNAGRMEYEQALTKENEALEKRKTDYQASEPQAIMDYCELVLSASKYPDEFPQDFNLEYVAKTKILVIAYSLPAPEHLPKVKEVKYVKAKDELAEISLSETESNRIYNDLLYKICLRTIYELFDADSFNALSAIVFNGWVKSIDKATGKETNGCLLSVQAKKEEFQNINLNNVDPKVCFKALKGIGSSQLHSLTPVAPMLNISREDKRFIASKEVENQIDERFNLAAMDWEDFEQLVREIFEKEFNKNGGEVKVTQASRDGGVDAVAFDPDPIHGGKIVIQAKRYTNTVGVGFVRELWGTVMNEGAMKGILITTADYGPDAYEFAKGKPLTLMNGANLLFLLEKHGHKAKIDIAEAKRFLGANIHNF
jgi:restriction system protein